MSVKTRADFKTFKSEYEDAAMPFVQAASIAQRGATDEELAIIALTLHSLVPDQDKGSSRWQTVALLEGVSCREMG